MSGTPKSLERLALEFQRLPGIGAKSAARLAYYLLRSPEEEAQRLARAIDESRAAVRRCSVCNTLTEADPCEICADPERDATLLCVVEEPGNLAAIEKTREYRGRYHVLWGALSPLRGVGPGRDRHGRTCAPRHRRRPRSRDRDEPQRRGRGHRALPRAPAEGHAACGSRASPSGCPSGETSSTPTRSRWRGRSRTAGNSRSARISVCRGGARPRPRAAARAAPTKV